MRISFDMLQAGYQSGIIRVIDSPNGDGVACGIGDNWFYFSNNDAAEVCSAAEFLERFSQEEIINDIYRALEDFWEDRDVFEDEYLYYFSYISERLREVPMESIHEKALRFVQENHDLAYEIYRVVDKEYYKEDIIDALEKRGIDVGSLSNIEFDKVVDTFYDNLQDNERWFESYWASAEGAIDEVLKDKGKKILFSVSMEDCGSIVDDALRTIRGVGVDMGSGCYELNAFEVDGEELDLYMDVCKLEDDGEVHYAVYYAVEYVDGDTLFHDWEFTGRLDADELKKVVHEIANTDFTEDIRKAMGKDNVGAVLADAAGRLEDLIITGKSSEEYVKG